MIDTIILRLHGIGKYETLIRNLDIMDVKGFTTGTGKVPLKDIMSSRRKGMTTEHIFDSLRQNRTGNYLIKSKVAKQLNASNHYSFSYFINLLKDYTEFNFSIPKYIHGSNVLQFVDHYSDPGYSYHYCSQMEYNLSRSFDLLDSFLKQFFKMEFLGCSVDPMDVEVNRIDVCFNQFFPNKKDALLYLEYQKRLKKKYARDEHGVLREYSTSLMYVTKRYSAKIYHKGTEYAKNDLKEHLKLNKEKGRQYFNVKEYQSIADKILRYELTIRSEMLNYLHKRDIFRRNCPLFINAFNTYLDVENSKQKNDRISKKIGELEANEKEAYLKANPYDKIDRESRSIHKYVSSLITKRTYFMLAIQQESKTYNKLTVNYECNTALFSKKLLNLCLSKLLEFIGEFQIKELPNEDQVKRLIDQYNQSSHKKLPTEEMVRFYSKLNQVGSFKETAKFYNYSRATLYRYKAWFAKINITENNLIPIDKVEIPKSSIDFRDYHNHITYTPGLLKSNCLTFKI